MKKYIITLCALAVLAPSISLAAPIEFQGKTYEDKEELREYLVKYIYQLLAQRTEFDLSREDTSELQEYTFKDSEISFTYQARERIDFSVETEEHGDEKAYIVDNGDRDAVVGFLATESNVSPLFFEGMMDAGYKKALESMQGEVSRVLGPKFSHLLLEEKMVEKNGMLFKNAIFKNPAVQNEYYGFTYAKTKKPIDGKYLWVVLNYIHAVDTDAEYSLTELSDDDMFVVQSVTEAMAFAGSLLKDMELK